MISLHYTALFYLTAVYVLSKYFQTIEAHWGNFVIHIRPSRVFSPVFFCMIKFNLSALSLLALHKKPHLSMQIFSTWGISMCSRRRIVCRGSWLFQESTCQEGECTTAPVRHPL